MYTIKISSGSTTNFYEYINPIRFSNFKIQRDKSTKKKIKSQPEKRKEEKIKEDEIIIKTEKKKEILESPKPYDLFKKLSYANNNINK